MYVMKSWKAPSASFVAAVLLAGCASTPAPVVDHSFRLGQPAPSAAASAPPVAASTSGVQTFGLGGHANGTLSAAGYEVAPGDTLYSIAFANGMDVRELAALNGLAPPYTIHPGQVLKLKPGAATAAGTTVVTTTATPPAATSAAAPAPAAPVFGPVTTQTMTATGVAPTGAASSGMPPATPAVPASAPSTGVAAMAPEPQSVAPAAPTPPVAGATRTVAGIAWQWPASGKVVGGFSAGSGGDGAGVDIAGKLGEPVRAAADGTVVYSGNGLIGYGELIIVKHNDTYLSAYGHNSRRLVKEGERVSAGQEIALMGASGAPRVELHFEIRKDGKPVDPLAFLPRR